jgi:hypothetical protein
MQNRRLQTILRTLCGRSIARMDKHFLRMNILMSIAALPQLVYVVRLWPSGPLDQRVWRATVQNPATGEHHIFADLPEFFAFIEECTQTSVKADAETNPARPEEGARE